jgi:uncharacterized protein (DUF1697 family)
LPKTALSTKINKGYFHLKKYVALFRGINVGGKNILPMKELKVMLDNIGCEEVQTYIQSGNVVFNYAIEKPNKLIDKIRNEILSSFGFHPKIMFFNKEDFKKVIDDNPFKTDDGKMLHFFFMDSPPVSPDLKQLEDIKTDTEDFKLLSNVFYLYAPEGIGRSKVASKVEKCLRVPCTGRNWNTVRKLDSMLQSDTT